jgi:predicted nucleic acid-binding protein
MDLVMDANILIAALIKKGITADLIVDENIHLFAPEFIMDEFQKHRDEIVQKIHRTKEDFEHFLEVIRQRTSFIPLEEIKPYLPQAIAISPDPKDVAYIALAIKTGASIWSNDKRLKDNQNKIPVLATHEILGILKH